MIPKKSHFESARALEYVDMHFSVQWIHLFHLSVEELVDDTQLQQIPWCFSYGF